MSRFLQWKKTEERDALSQPFRAMHCATGIWFQMAGIPKLMMPLRHYQ
jgi:hypothetical protein